MDECSSGCPENNWCSYSLCYPCPEGTTRPDTTGTSIVSTWNPDCTSIKGSILYNSLSLLAVIILIAFWILLLFFLIKENKN
jgi:hypothetical protein